VLLHQVSCKLRCTYIVTDQMAACFCRLHAARVHTQWDKCFWSACLLTLGTMKFHLLIVVNYSHLFIFSILFTFGNGKVHWYFTTQVVAGLWFFPTKCRGNTRKAARNWYPRWTMHSVPPYNTRADNIQIKCHQMVIKNFYYYKFMVITEGKQV
jgi:hypothetical protein